MKQRVINNVRILIGALLFSLSFSVFAQDLQDDAAFTCASAVNVMDCIKQTQPSAVKAQTPEAALGALSGVPINTQLLGLSNPLTAAIRYDNYLAWVLDVGYAQQFYDTAAAFKLSAGLNELRANVTLGYAITPKQQIKLTYEYLTQNLPFDYSSGTINNWVSQNALGGAYRYLLDNGIVRYLEAYGSYTKAASKELSDVEMYTDNVLTQINQRRIAGGTEITAGGAVAVTPLKNTILKLGAGYSSVTFDTIWEENQANMALAYNAELSHLLTPTTMISAGIGNTASSRAHTAKVSQILPWNVEASLLGQYNLSHTEIPSSFNVGASLSYPAPKTYTNVFAESIGKLKDWVAKPVVYHSRVLAIAEERLLQVQITTKAIPPASMPVGTNLTPAIQTSDYFFFTQDVFDKINYNILSITQQGNDNNTFPASALNLQVVPLDSFNAVLNSSAPVQASAMTPGQYTLTLQASGYRSGQVVSQVNNPVNISVGQNTSLGGPTWSTSSKATLAPATAGQPYSPGTNLDTLVVDNSGLSGGDSYTFGLVNAPSWLSLSADGQWLVSTNNQPVPTDASNPTPVTISVVSNVSGKSPQSGPKLFNLTVSNAGTNPTWTGVSVLPDAEFAMPYLDKGININLNSTAYINPGYPGALTFQCTSGCDPNGNITGAVGLALNPNGLIVGTPNNLNQVSTTAEFTVVATDTTTQLDSGPQNFTLTINPNNSNFVAIWNPNQSIFPNGVATGTTPRAINLNDGYVNIITPPGDQISQYAFTPNTASTPNTCGNQLTLSSDGMLQAQPTATTPTTCTYTIKVTSKATGEPYNLASLQFQILAGPVWKDNPTYLPNAPFSLTKGSYHIKLNDYIKSYTGILSFQLDTTKSIPAWIGINGISFDAGTGEYYLNGTPDDTFFLKGYPVYVYIIATDNTSPTAPPYQTHNTLVQVVPNPQLTLPAWNDQGIFPASATYGSSTYSESLNPYSTTGCTKCMTKTKQGEDVVTSDVLTFSFNEQKSSCSWLQMSTDGVLSNKPGTVVSGLSPCSMEFTVTSKAAGTSTIIDKAKLEMTGEWPAFNNGQDMGSVQFDNTTARIDLFKAISNFDQASPGLFIQLVPNPPAPYADQNNLWTIENGQYLKRKTNNQATDVSTASPSTIYLLASNSASGSNQISGTVNVTVSPDPSVNLVFTQQGSTQKATSTTLRGEISNIPADDPIYPISGVSPPDWAKQPNTSSYVVPCLDPNCATVVSTLSNSLSYVSQNINIGTPSAGTVSVGTFGNPYYGLKIFFSKMSDQDVGIYSFGNNLAGTSTAAGSALKTVDMPPLTVRLLIPEAGAPNNDIGDSTNYHIYNANSKTNNNITYAYTYAEFWTENVPTNKPIKFQVTTLEANGAANFYLCPNVNRNLTSAYSDMKKYCYGPIPYEDRYANLSRVFCSNTPSGQGFYIVLESPPGGSTRPTVTRVMINPITSSATCTDYPKP